MWNLEDAVGVATVLTIGKKNNNKIYDYDTGLAAETSKVVAYLYIVNDLFTAC